MSIESDTLRMKDLGEKEGIDKRKNSSPFHSPWNYYICLDGKEKLVRFYPGNRPHDMFGFTKCSNGTG